MDYGTINGNGSRIFYLDERGMSEEPRRTIACSSRPIIYRYRAGIPWRDLPERFGDWKATHKRFRRWCESGVFERIFKILAVDADNEYMMLDSTAVRAHQHSAGAQKKKVRIKPSAAPAAD